MQVGNIVFAPFKDSMWPGKIIAIQTMAEVKLYKVKHTFKLPIKTLVPFNPTTLANYLSSNNDKGFTSAVKTAQNEVKKILHRQQQQPNGESGLHGIQLMKAEEKQPMMKDEEGRQFQRELPECESVLEVLLCMREEDLEMAKSSNLQEISYINPKTQQKCTYQLNKELSLAILIEYLLARLLCETTPKIIQSYQRKLSIILGGFKFRLQTLINRDILKLIKIVTEYHDCSVLQWKNAKFVDTLRKFKESTRRQLENHLLDYTNIPFISSTLTNFNILGDQHS